MGSSTYSFESRSERAAVKGYATKRVDEIFTQSVERKIHDSMRPDQALLRESRDSETHPNSVPIIIALDVTGSMRKIPYSLVKDGLPKMMSKIIQSGVDDPQILFLAIGDYVYDRFPLQVGQFESGDAELDMWLTRTFLEGGGGSNREESYLETYYYAGFHTETDAWDKRGKKGFLFTIGDEPSMNSLPASAVKEIMGTSQASSYTFAELLEKAQEKYEVYHLHIMEGNAGPRSLSFWKDKLGQNCIQVDNHEDVSKFIADIVTAGESVPTTVTAPHTTDGSKPSTEVFL